MNDERHPGGRGVEISEAPSEGRGTVSRPGGISECGPPFDGSQSSDYGSLTATSAVHGVPSDLESVLEWARRAGEDRTEVPALLDELEVPELRAIAARLVQLVGLLELCPAKVEPAYFIARVAALSGDFAQDPWTAAEPER